MPLRVVPLLGCTSSLAHWLATCSRLVNAGCPKNAYVGGIAVVWSGVAVTVAVLFGLFRVRIGGEKEDEGVRRWCGASEVHAPWTPRSGL